MSVVDEVVDEDFNLIIATLHASFDARSPKRSDHEQKMHNELPGVTKCNSHLTNG